MKPVVYLSGPISIQNYAGAVDWYGEAIKHIGAFGGKIGYAMPMRGKGGLRTVQGDAVIGTRASDDPSGPGVFSDDEIARVLGTRAAIAGRDRYDVQRSSCVLMNLLGCRGKVSIGCMIEAGWADAARVPIVLVAEPGNVHEGHAILEGIATYRVANLKMGCIAVRTLLEPWL